MSLQKNSTDAVSAPPPARTLRHRVPAQSVMAECLRVVQKFREEFPDSTGMPADARSWHTGAEGEIEVAHELAMLPADWAVLHSIPVGTNGADIDHLVIGPGGIFVINTKTHHGCDLRVGTHVVWLGGQRYPYQRDVQHRADDVQMRFASILGPGDLVHPLLVFVGARSVSRSGPQSVHACTARGLVNVLLEYPDVPSGSHLAAVIAKAEQPVTWGVGRDVLTEPDPTADFLALGAAPSRARRAKPGARLGLILAAVLGGIIALPIVGMLAVAVSDMLAAILLHH